MKIYENYLSGSRILTVVFILYLGTRVTAAIYFVPQNDEVNFIQYSMLMARDWQKYKYMSLDGTVSVWGDRTIEYKQPLQFWLNSLTVDFWKNPLVGGRAWGVVFGFFGIFFTQLLITKIWDKQAGIISTVFITFSSFYLFFDSVWYTEVFVYGLGAVFIYVLYQFLLSNRWEFGVFAGFLLLGVLLMKGTGLLWIGHALIVPIFVFANQSKSMTEIMHKVKSRGRIILGKTLLLIILVKIVHYILIDWRFSEHYHASYQSRLQMNLSEILEFPFNQWINNISFFFYGVFQREFALFTVPVVGFLTFTFSWLMLREKILFLKFCAVLGMFFISFMPAVLVAKNNVIHYFGTGLYYAYALIAMGMSVFLGHYSRKRWADLAMLTAGLGLCWSGAMSLSDTVRWGQSEISMARTPPGQGNGSGIMEMINYVSKLPPSILIADPQWGHPITALQIFHERYFPHVDYKHWPLQADGIELYFRKAYRKGVPLYFLADPRSPGERPQIDFILNSKLYCAEKHVILKRYRGRVLPGTSIAICQSDMEKLKNRYDKFSDFCLRYQDELPELCSSQK
ncbi:MAG: glycosyltransferase family 39 protein [SAR324 cluster bacterium]|nr:glycosyltransferase family 39 protein [SAR324 cluster bacterium]